MVATITKIAKMGCGKWAGLVAVNVMFHLLTVIAQPGFLSIACGGTTNYIARHNITWFADTNYIEVGERADIGHATYEDSYGFYLQTLRFFPKPLKKSCYHLPVTPNVLYLVRLWFAVGNYTGFQNMSTYAFAFSIETPGMLFVKNINITDLSKSTVPFYYEKVLVSSGRVLYICLIRTMETNDPFISAIELRTLRDGMYQRAKRGTLLSLETRIDLGGNSLIRYPLDQFDRLWDVQHLQRGVRPISLQGPISTNSTQDLPPSVVMQTAWTTRDNSVFLSLPVGDNTTLVLLYFADIGPVNMTLKVSINGREIPKVIKMTQNYSALQTEVVVNDTVEDSYIDMGLSALTNSTRLIINAVETYGLVDTQPATYSKDIDALEALKMMFGIKDWISDPCYLIPWKGIGCVNISSVVRISEIKLSACNLSGRLPENIAGLTALANLSLEDNHLTGPLPNFSSLIMLKRLHLQNNNLTGTVPHWLCGLENLRELFIDNNSFSGVIPACILKPSLNFSSAGNRYLHFPSNPGKNRLSLILSITLSGSLVIGLVLIVIIVMRRKKFKRKESSRVGKESKHLVDEDNSGIIVPNTTKSRAFTLEEITEATQNFNQKIGQGGFGSVFLGKLQQKIDVAVKVLSLYSKQGVQEFLNEVDLLSKVHHKNLVSLLGYCTESKELMLVYEYMSGGSLRDHLYGHLAEFSQLNWKTRLKIALDAAQGLEYLHVGCTPKIIHRDVKTANILTDKNFNGKLSDFGLSRMTIDEEVSHVTTTVKGTLGYMDPEYFSTKMLTEKSDVYSFGVVLLEIICGRQPINVNLPDDELNLVRWVTPYVEMDEIPGKIEEIIDKRLDRNYDVKSISCVAKLAIRCVQDEPSSRPRATEVVAELKEAIKLEKDSAFLISEIVMKYEESGASQASLYVGSSGPKDTDSGGSSSHVPTVSHVGR